MKKANPLLLLFSLFLFQACDKPGTIEIQNNISQATLTNVRWGGIIIDSELIPGQSSGQRQISRYDKKLPARHKVTFTMTSNKKSIYLETIDEYALNPDQVLVITLTDNTKVKNPNQ